MMLTASLGFIGTGEGGEVSSLSLKHVVSRNVSQLIAPFTPLPI